MNPTGHRQMKWLILSTHVPSFWQGYEEHSSTSIKTHKRTTNMTWLLLDVHTGMKTWGNPKVQGVKEKVMIWPQQNVGRTLLYAYYIQMWPGEILSLRLSPWLAGWNSTFTSWLSLSWRGRTQRMSTSCEGWKNFIIRLPIWHLRPVKPAKHEQVKEGFPVMQSSMQRPPFWQGLKLAQTEAEEHNGKESEQTDIFLFVLSIMFSNLLDTLILFFLSFGGIPESLQLPTCTWESSIRKTQRPG